MENAQPKPDPKVPVSFRMARDLVDAMKDTGPGWQPRAEQILRIHYMHDTEID
jgi:uncharacterized protein (DUF4415 family)